MCLLWHLLPHVKPPFPLCACGVGIVLINELQRGGKGTERGKNPPPEGESVRPKINVCRGGTNFVWFSLSSAELC